MDPVDPLTLVRETCAAVTAKAAHVTIDQHGEAHPGCPPSIQTPPTPVRIAEPGRSPGFAAVTLLVCCAHAGVNRRASIRAAIKTVAAGIGERELHVITTAGFDSGSWQGVASILLCACSHCKRIPDPTCASGMTAGSRLGDW